MVDLQTYASSKDGSSYLSYADLLDSSGLQVVSQEAFGSYQGDYLFRVSNGVDEGILIQGYGSCSGCDALEAAHPYGWDEESPADWSSMEALRDQMVASVIWRGGASLKETLEAKLRSNDDWWSYSEEGLKERAVFLAGEIDAAN